MKRASKAKRPSKKMALQRKQSFQGKGSFEWSGRSFKRNRFFPMKTFLQRKCPAGEYRRKRSFKGNALPKLSVFRRKLVFKESSSFRERVPSNEASVLVKENAFSMKPFLQKKRSAKDEWRKRSFRKKSASKATLSSKKCSFIEKGPPHEAIPLSKGGALSRSRLCTAFSIFNYYLWIFFIYNSFGEIIGPLEAPRRLKLRNMYFE